MDPFVTPVLALVILATLAFTEAVEIELLRLIGLTITSVASLLAALLSYKNAHRTKRIEEKVNRGRKAVRETPEGNVIVVEDRRGRGDRAGTES